MKNHPLSIQAYGCAAFAAAVGLYVAHPMGKYPQFVEPFDYFMVGFCIFGFAVFYWLGAYFDYQDFLSDSSDGV